MQSDDNLPDTPPAEVADSPTSSTAPVVGRVQPLRREAMMAASERQNSALFAALFSLAGVGFGFGLSQLASANNDCHHRVTVEHQRTRAAAPAITMQYAPAPARAPQLTWLGVEGHSANGAALVTRVFPNSPAEAAGLEDGDTILAVDRRMITSFGDLIVEVRDHDMGERAVLRYATPEGEIEATSVTFGEISRSEFRHLANH